MDNADALFEARLLTHRLVSPSPTSQPVLLLLLLLLHAAEWASSAGLVAHETA